MLVGYYGQIGSGKNILSLHNTLIKNNYYKIYANFEIKVNNFEKIDIAELLHIEAPKNKNKKIKVILDEAYTILESRMSLSDINQFMSYVEFQSRKKGMDIDVIAQLRGTVDIRYRKMEHMTFFGKARREKINGKMNNEDFHYVVTNGFKAKKIGLKYSGAKKLFPIYNTNEVIMPINLKNLEASIGKLDNEKLNRIINEIVSLVLEVHKKDDCTITAGYVKDVMLEYNQPLQFSTMAFNRIQRKISES